MYIFKYRKSHLTWFSVSFLFCMPVDRADLTWHNELVNISSVYKSKNMLSHVNTDCSSWRRVPEHTKLVQRLWLMKCISWKKCQLHLTKCDMGIAFKSKNMLSHVNTGCSARSPVPEHTMRWWCLRDGGSVSVEKRVNCTWPSATRNMHACQLELAWRRALPSSCSANQTRGNRSYHEYVLTPWHG